MLRHPERPPQSGPTVGNDFSEIFGGFKSQRGRDYFRLHVRQRVSGVSRALGKEKHQEGVASCLDDSSLDARERENGVEVTQLSGPLPLW